MAVQKNRKTRARRGTRRSHDSLQAPTLSVDQTTGETHLRHHMTPDGFYRGRQVLNVDGFSPLIPQSTTFHEKAALRSRARVNAPKTFPPMPCFKAFTIEMDCA